MSWFESVFGFPEPKQYEKTRQLFHVEQNKDGEITLETRPPVVGDGTIVPARRRFHVGRFETPSLKELRHRLSLLSISPTVVDNNNNNNNSAATAGGGLSFSHTVGNVADLHRDFIHNHGSVFQAASQFNCLEMTSPAVTPDDGITRYSWDRTQGPACAMACPAGTLYRNYFWNGTGQGGASSSSGGNRQMDLLADMGKFLGNNDNDNNENDDHHDQEPSNKYWKMINGYALPAARGSIAALRQDVLERPGFDRDAAISQLRLGIHWNTQVDFTCHARSSSTLLPASLLEQQQQHRVTQVYASAIPIAYDQYTTMSMSQSHQDWEPMARLVLDGAYEATLAAAVLLSREERRRVKVFLTKLGGGVFANRVTWIASAMVRALTKFQKEQLDVVLVHYGAVEQSYVDYTNKFFSNTVTTATM